MSFPARFALLLSQASRRLPARRAPALPDLADDLADLWGDRTHCRLDRPGARGRLCVPRHNSMWETVAPLLAQLGRRSPQVAGSCAARFPAHSSQKPGECRRLAVAMKITGHKTESVYRRYAIVSPANLQEAARKLEGAFPGTVPPLRLTSVP
jgi:hypothetical protein